MPGAPPLTPGALRSAAAEGRAANGSGMKLTVQQEGQALLEEQ